MHKSVDEPREDGKASPKVGAVLLKPQGTVETASRGELRHGDHAEFTLLERKNRDTLLDPAYWTWPCNTLRNHQIVMQNPDSLPDIMAGLNSKTFQNIESRHNSRQVDGIDSLFDEKVADHPNET